MIRTRAEQGGPNWDHLPDLYCKGFLLREAGRNGARTSSYASQYLWRNDSALGEFFAGERFDNVATSFGRPDVHTQLALDARRGNGSDPRFAYRKDVLIPIDADLQAAYDAEIAHNRELASQPGSVMAAVGVDVRNWTFTRVLYSERELPESDVGTAYEVLYFARPQFDALT